MVVLNKVAIIKTEAMTHHDLVRAFNSSRLAFGFITPITANKREAKIKIPNIKPTTISKSLLLVNAM
jgi:hypothetical protein